MLTQWFPWQQQPGGQEGVRMSEVTVPFKKSKGDKTHSLSFLRIEDVVRDDVGNDVTKQRVLAPVSQRQ